MKAIDELLSYMLVALIGVSIFLACAATTMSCLGSHAQRTKPTEREIKVQLECWSDYLELKDRAEVMRQALHDCKCPEWVF